MCASALPSRCVYGRSVRRHPLERHLQVGAHRGVGVLVDRDPCRGVRHGRRRARRRRAPARGRARSTSAVMSTKATRRGVCSDEVTIAGSARRRLRRGRTRRRRVRGRSRVRHGDAALEAVDDVRGRAHRVGELGVAGHQLVRLVGVAAPGTRQAELVGDLLGRADVAVVEPRAVVDLDGVDDGARRAARGRGSRTSRCARRRRRDAPRRRRRRAAT